MLNLREFIRDNYQWTQDEADELHDSGNYSASGAIHHLLDELYSHYYEREMQSDPSWIKIDFNEVDSFPEDYQMVTYFFAPFGDTFDGIYSSGTFCSDKGFSDVYDAPYWKPLDA